MRSKLLVLLFLLSFALQVSSQEKQSFYFFSDNDIHTIKQSAKTDWGKVIVEGFRNTIQERLKYSMDIPVTEGGYFHDYFCPVHNLQFTFDWNKPKAHFCNACDKYWTNEDKYDWAWIAKLHGKNLDYLVANMYLYIVSDSAVYAEKAKRMLLDYAAKYPGYLEHNRQGNKTEKYSGKMFAQSLDEAVWAIDAARVFQLVKPIMSQEEKVSFETNYLEPCANLLMRKKDHGNWQAWHIGAIAALGVALENDRMIDIAINKPEFGYRTVMSENVYTDGWWKEGSVVYHFYPLRSIILTAEAVRCRGIDLYDKQLFNMFHSPIHLAYADYSLPSQNDGWYGSSLLQQAGLYELAAKRFHEPSFINLLELCYQVVLRNSPYALINGAKLDNIPAPLRKESTLFPDLGVAVLRSNNRSVVFKYGPHGGGHGHPDKLSISIHDGKNEILPDLGTTAYGVPDYQEWYKNTFSHSTVTVDRRNQQMTCGKLIRLKTYKNGGIAEAKSDSAYPGVSMNRKLVLKGNKLYDSFSCKSDTPHTYDYILILTEPVDLKASRDTILAEYKRIENMKYRIGEQSTCFRFKDATLELKVNSPTSFFIMTGIAPGIPPSIYTDMECKSYPLIIRCKEENMNLEASWRFDK